MPRSTERILVSHAGALPRPPELQRLFNADLAERDAFAAALPGAVAEVVGQQVRYAALRVEALNHALRGIPAPRHEHEHERTVFQDVRPPDGAPLRPGVVGHATDIIEHPEAIAQRLIRYAQLVGRENVIAGTDCGLGGRVGHPEIVWAKLEELAAGARLASRTLFGD